MLQQETTALLGRIHPFDLLPLATLEELCKTAGLEYFRRGTEILQQGAKATENLFVIKRGTVSLFLIADDGSELVVDYRGAGEYFGLLSLISGEPLRSSVRAEEDTMILLIPKASLRAVLDAHPAISDKLLKSYFLEFVDRTYEDSRRRSSGLTNGHRVLFSTPVGDIVHRDPVTTGGSTSIQEAARLMEMHGISSLVVTDGSGAPVGIMTDRDLREKAVAQGRDLSQPVRAIMSSPIIQVDAGEPCSEALFLMMRHNIHHVPVTAAGRFLGMVTNHDFMVLQGSSPTLLAKKVLAATSLEHLEDARAHLQTAVAVLSREGARARDICRVITEVTRKLIGRTAALAESELGPPPVPLTVIALGEAARSELSIQPGPELALARADRADTKEATADYARRLRARLEGTPVLALRNGRDGPVSLSQWADDLHRWVDGSGPPPAAGAGVFEMNPVLGNARSVDRLRLDLITAAAANEAFRARLVTSAVANRPPLGFLGKLVVSTSGEDRHRLDLCEKGIVPLVDVVRILALEKAMPERSTLARLRDLASRHGYVHSSEVENALEYLQALRINQQLAQLQAGEEPDGLVDPETLANAERKGLKEVFQLTASLYDSLARRYGVLDGGP